jgi:hypothetical protein
MRAVSIIDEALRRRNALRAAKRAHGRSPGSPACYPKHPAAAKKIGDATPGNRSPGAPGLESVAGSIKLV